MARTYIDMLNSAMVYQQAFNAAHSHAKQCIRSNDLTGAVATRDMESAAQLFGYTAAIADMFGKTHEDVRTDVHNFTEAVELREGE